jgi:hypothetical protein
MRDSSRPGHHIERIFQKPQTDRFSRDGEDWKAGIDVEERHWEKGLAVNLVVPYIGELQPVDIRLIRVAEFLGISCETLSLANVAEHAEFLKTTVPDRRSCFVVNPQVMKEWVGPGGIPADLVAFLLSRFPHLLVHGLRMGGFDTEMVAALSRGRVHSVHAIDGVNSLYEVARNSPDICGAFSGLSFGPTNPANDQVFSCISGDPAIRTLISIGGDSFMVVLEQEGSEIFFLGSEDIADLDAEVGDSPVIEYFSRLVPHAMALRHMFGEECWRPCQSYASVIIDDPLLKRRYGYLNFESLQCLMRQHHFHTTVAFIPHNFRRSSAQVTRMFRENRACFALCFHGNDHTGAEFASTDKALLNTLLATAEDRMSAHHDTTGLACDKVMVFPQGNFSVEAMQVLRSRNFYAAVNTVPHPTGHPVRLTIRELAQPAVLRYGGFPLFLRKPSRQMENHDIAFDVFFGRPVLIVEHHEIFQSPGALAEAVSRINAVDPKVCWTNLENVVSNSILKRRGPDGTVHVRAYSGTVRISNESNCVERYSIEWNCVGLCPPVEQVLRDGTRVSCFENEDGTIRVSIELFPGDSHTFSVVYRNDHIEIKNLGLRWNAEAFLRRRLSEVRDNYLSKNPRVLAAAKTLQRGLRRRSRRREIQ